MSYNSTNLSEHDSSSPQPEAIFFAMMEPRIRLQLLLLLQERKKIAPAELQQLFKNKKMIFQQLWELCNQQLIQKKFQPTDCFYELTPLGADYLNIVERLHQWSTEHHFYGGKY